MDTVKEVVQREVKAYTGKGLNGHSYLVANPDQLAFTVVTIGYIDGQRFANADLIVRITENHVVVERDDNDPPLVEALLQAGILRSQIILAYVGEPVPESA
jgi:hypothetical protein